MTNQTRRPFLTLLKHEIGFQQLSRLELALALTFFYLPWLALNILMFALGRDLTAFYPGILGGLLLLWLMAMCSLAAYPQVPVIWSNMTNFKAFEFLFTRAVDRRLNFRAKAAATLLLVLVPQLPGLVWSLAQPDMVVRLDANPGAGVVSRVFIEGRVFPLERYVQAFPGSERQLGEKPEDGMVRLRIRGGLRAYAAWLAWSTMLGMALFFAFYALVGRHLRCSGWWANTVLLAPLLVVIGLVCLSVRLGFYPGNESFLFFREHEFVCFLLLIVVGYASLRWCEDRFAELEIL